MRTRIAIVSVALLASSACTSDPAQQAAAPATPVTSSVADPVLEKRLYERASRSSRSAQPVRPPVRKVTKASPRPQRRAQVGTTVWDRLMRCESWSHGKWQANTGNGYYGGLQFSLTTWRSVGGTGYPHHASREEQIRRGKILQARSGWGQWPHCSRKLGLR
jgi:hypothetical protein